jgi:hypothetical protein
MLDYLEQLYFARNDQGNAGFDDVSDLLGHWDAAPISNQAYPPLQHCGYCRRPFSHWGDREFCSERCEQESESLARACANFQRAMRSPVVRRSPVEDDEEWTDEECHLFTGYYVVGPDGSRRPCFAID